MVMVKAVAAKMDPFKADNGAPFDTETEDPENNTVLSEEEEYTNSRDKSLWFTIKYEHRLLRWVEVSLNPIVTVVSMACILAFVIWSILMPDVASAEFNAWQAWIGKHFTWLYIGSQDVWMIFIIIIYLSKYSSIKLGKDDSTPEYNTASWFSMLFACGVSTGLFFFGVAEPIFHYTGKNRYSADPTMPDNKLAQEAMNVTLYHWGLHGWVVYTIVGLLIGLMAHREGLPMTIKSCFYPLIGDKIFGWPGDLVDVMSVIATLFGVCTSLGLGTMQINEGMRLLSGSIEVSTQTQVIIIWCITSVATLSVLSGVKYGIRRISEICFMLGLVLMLTVLFLDNTVFLLNLYTQSMGYYFQYILQIGFHSDAFEQLGESFGSEDRGRFLPDTVETTDGPAGWMNAWTIFYWGWWIAWCPFVGMFIAKISAGRTVKEVITGTMAAPVIYVFMWLIIFGGAGLRMEREAASMDLCCHNINVSRILNLATQSPDNQLILSNTLCKEGECSSCSGTILNNYINKSVRLGEIKSEIDAVGAGSWGVTTLSRDYTRLSCRSTEQMWFDMMMSYGDMGHFLSGFSLVSLVLYFVTSSDSGSLVIDCLASNGHPHPPPLQRVLWALLEGLTATALLVAGGSKALRALQAVSIASGLVYTVLMCIACVALWRELKVAAGEAEGRPSFHIDILDPFLADPMVELFSPEFRKRTKENAKLFGHVLLNIFITPYSVAKCCRLLYGSRTFYPVLLSLSVLLILIPVLHILHFTGAVHGCWSLAWVSYLLFVFIIAVVRLKARNKLNIPGSPLEDYCVALVLYPSVVLQMTISMEAVVNVTPEKKQRCSVKRGNIPAAPPLMVSDNGALLLPKGPTEANGSITGANGSNGSIAPWSQKSTAAVGGHNLDALQESLRKRIFTNTEGTSAADNPAVTVEYTEG